MCSHEPSTSHVNQDYREPSGFQNCLQGPWYYLLNPNFVVLYLGCRLREQTALNLSMKCIRQQRSGSAGPPFRKSYLHLTHDVNLLGENQYQAAEAEEIAGCFAAGFPVTSGCFHRCRIFIFFFVFMLPNQQQEETCRKNRHPAGVKGQASPCHSERPSASSYQSNSFGFILPPQSLLLRMASSG